MGLPFGYLIGFLVTVLTKNETLWFVIGPALGLSAGVIIGAILEKKNKDKIRALTDNEKKFRRLSMITLTALILIGILSLIVVMVITN